MAPVATQVTTPSTDAAAAPADQKDAAQASSTSQAAAPAQAQAASPVADEDVPDPDEDDLDDLDDMLEEFSSAKVSTSQKPPAASIPVRSATEPATAAAPSAPSLSAEAPLPGGAEDLSEAEFQRQLQEGMAELMSDLESSVSTEGTHKRRKPCRTCSSLLCNIARYAETV